MLKILGRVLASKRLGLGQFCVVEGRKDLMLDIFEVLANGLYKSSSMIFHKNLFKTGRAAELEMMLFHNAKASQLQIFNVYFAETLESEVLGAEVIGTWEGQLTFDWNLIA